jgi:HSP20 family protein
MATQTKNSEQSQQSQGQAMARGSELQRRGGGHGLGIPLTPADFFRMDPLSLMRRVSQELDRALSEPDGREQSERMWVPAIEVTQQDGKYIVKAELPGLNASDVKLEVTDDAIVIQGERKIERDETKGGVHVTERRYGRFYRAIPLPEGAKTDEASATFENGILEVDVPTEEARNKRREISIQSGGAGATESAAAKPANSSGPASGSTSRKTGGSEKAA